MCVHSAYYTHGRAAAQKHAKYKKFKDYSVKEYYCVGYIHVNCLQAIMDSHCMYQNTTYVLAHEQMRLLSGDAFSLCALKFRRLNSISNAERTQLTLKGNGR